MLKIIWTTKFKKDYKRIVKRNKDLAKLGFIIDELADNKTLDEKYKDHLLAGNYANCRECHVEFDWLLIYKIEENYLVLERTGTHSDLF